MILQSIGGNSLIFKDEVLVLGQREIVPISEYILQNLDGTWAFSCLDDFICSCEEAFGIPDWVTRN